MKKFLCAVLVVLCLVGVAYPAKRTSKKAPKHTPKKAERMLTSEEIEGIYEKEKMPVRELFTKISLEQQRAIVAECNDVSERDVKEAKKKTDSVMNYMNDPLKWTRHHRLIFENLNLNSRRKIAKKYGIKAGDTFELEYAEVAPDFRTETLNQ